MNQSLNKFRGVSSTVKLPVSKTGLGGSNPSAPARVLGRAGFVGPGPRRSTTGKQERLMATIVEEGAIGTLKSWPERIKTFYNDVRTEMKKVTAPSFKEVRATTAVVIITVFLFGVYFAVVDYVLRNSVDWLFRAATRR